MSSEEIDLGIFANGLRNASRKPTRAARICKGTCSTVTRGGITPSAIPARNTSTVPNKLPGTDKSRETYAL